MSTVRTFEEIRLSELPGANPEGLAGYTLAMAKVVFNLDLKGWDEVDGEPSAVFSYNPSSSGKSLETNALLYRAGEQAYFLITLEGHDEEGATQVVVYVSGIAP